MSKIVPNEYDKMILRDGTEIEGNMSAIGYVNGRGENIMHFIEKKKPILEFCDKWAIDIFASLPGHSHEETEKHLKNLLEYLSVKSTAKYTEGEYAEQSETWCWSFCEDKPVGWVARTKEDIRKTQIIDSGGIQKLFATPEEVLECEKRGYFDAIKYFMSR